MEVNITYLVGLLWKLNNIRSDLSGIWDIANSGMLAS